MVFKKLDFFSALAFGMLGDALPIAAKHAGGMSLRHDAICDLAYCGRHDSSHLPSKRKRHLHRQSKCR